VTTSDVLLDTLACHLINLKQKQLQSMGQWKKQGNHCNARCFQQKPALRFPPLGIKAPEPLDGKRLWGSQCKGRPLRTGLLWDWKDFNSGSILQILPQVMAEQ